MSSARWPIPKRRSCAPFGSSTAGSPRPRSSQAPELSEIADVLDRLLHVDWFGEEPSGIVQEARHPVQRIGLLLDPIPDIGDWARSERIDAVFVHRPWGLSFDALSGVGVLAYHLPFDEGMTLGYNPRLAETLGMSDFRSMGGKDARPIGMVGRVTEQPVDEFVARLRTTFGGLDQVDSGDRTVVSRVAVVGAMGRVLVAMARHEGAGLYVTGQYREIARPVVVATGLGVAVVGHRRSEIWGLRELAAVLRAKWPGLRVLVRA